MVMATYKLVKAAGLAKLTFKICNLVHAIQDAQGLPQETEFERRLSSAEHDSFTAHQKAEGTGEEGAGKSGPRLQELQEVTFFTFPPF